MRTGYETIQICKSWNEKTAHNDCALTNGTKLATDRPSLDVILPGESIIQHPRWQAWQPLLLLSKHHLRLPYHWHPDAPAQQPPEDRRKPGTDLVHQIPEYPATTVLVDRDEGERRILQKGIIDGPVYLVESDKCAASLHGRRCDEGTFIRCYCHPFSFPPRISCRSSNIRSCAKAIAATPTKCFGSVGGGLELTS